MRPKTGTILAVMNVIGWIVFIGLIIKGGAIVFSYIVSWYNPNAAKNLYMGMDLYQLSLFSFPHYTVTVVLLVLILVLEAYTAFLVTRAISKIKLSHPFTIEVSDILERISTFILFVWVLAVINNVHMNWLAKQGVGVDKLRIPGDFLFMAGVVFVFAQIFKKGVELQTENELTV